MAAQSSIKKFFNAQNILLAIFIIFAAISIGANFWIADKNHKKIVVINTIDEEIRHWQSTIRNNPNYRDAYLNLAKLYEQKSEIGKAQLMVKKAHEVDPLHEETYEYGRVLGIRRF